jgi:hypothetical protein
MLASTVIIQHLPCEFHYADLLMPKNHTFYTKQLSHNLEKVSDRKHLLISIINRDTLGPAIDNQN